MRALPGVIGVDTFRGTRILHGGRPAFAAGVDFGVQARLGNLQFVHGRAGELLSAARSRGGVVVSESFASHHRVRAGDRLALATPSGVASLPVLGVYRDYTTDAGGVLMDAALFERLWRAHRIESLAVYAAPGVRVDDLRAAVLAAARDDDLVLNATPNRELRARALQVFDQTFQITFALQAIAILVAVLGVASTLTALILQRGREIAVLRAVGAQRGQVQRMVLVESVAIGPERRAARVRVRPGAGDDPDSRDQPPVLPAGPSARTSKRGCFSAPGAHGGERGAGRHRAGTAGGDPRGRRSHADGLMRPRRAWRARCSPCWRWPRAPVRRPRPRVRSSATATAW